MWAGFFAGLLAAYMGIGSLLDRWLHRRSTVECPGCHGVGCHPGLSEDDLARLAEWEDVTELRESGAMETIPCTRCFGARRVSVAEARRIEREAREFVMRALVEVERRERVA